MHHIMQLVDIPLGNLTQAPSLLWEQLLLLLLLFMSCISPNQKQRGREQNTQ